VVGVGFCSAGNIEGPGDAPIDQGLVDADGLRAHPGELIIGDGEQMIGKDAADIDDALVRVA
jgi:hypothetical protein